MRRWGSKQPSKANQRASLLALVLHRGGDIPEREIPRIAKTHRVPEDTLRQMCRDERARRAA